MIRGMAFGVIFSYFTEFQPKEKRGMMISALATFWMCGNIIAASKSKTILRFSKVGGLKKIKI
jgi:VNT family MFS transporter (synaptic vesicle glycoprotein 2)